MEESVTLVISGVFGLIILICFFYLCADVSKIRKLLEEEKKNKENK